MSFILPTSMHDLKVLSTPVMFRNGAIVLIDGLEASIIETAPFQACFFGTITSKLSGTR
jgi:hypothetical protein